MTKENRDGFSQSGSSHLDNSIFYASVPEILNDQSASRCPRCGQMVYPVEKIGPIKGRVYHKVCFKCIKCGRHLDIRSYFTNAADLSDNQIYCGSHFPRSNKGCVDVDNLHIRNFMQAPKASVIQSLNLPKPNVDARSVGIIHAVQAQSLLHNEKDKFSDHHFPALPRELIEARSQLLIHQRDLEIKQRREEDALFLKFQEERRAEEKRIEKEMLDEWKLNLEQLRAKYEKEMNACNVTSKKRDKDNLEKDLTLKRTQRRKSLKQIILEQEQNETAALISRQSEEMLELIKRKQADFKKDGINIYVSSNRNPPLPAPPTVPKYSLYTDLSVIEYVDKQAIEVAASEQASYTELIDNLTQGLFSDLEKARAIFRWITVKDLNSIDFSENLAPDTPLGILRGIKYGTEAYHTLFMRLCSYAGLYCVNIKGHSKSVGYEPGMQFVDSTFLNTWNAVLINGEWRFVQCNWGARHLVMSKDNKESLIDKSDKIQYEYDEHYFLPDPEDFILEFFPFDEKWQLLKKPITLKQFEQLPFVRSLFFHYSLSFVNHKEAVLYANERGACDIRLRMPDALKNDLAFHFHLRYILNESESAANENETDEICGIKLERYVLHTIEDEIVSFNVHLPKVGSYYLELFANVVQRNINPFGQSFKLRCICKYRLECKQLDKCMHPLPSCALGEWGPQKALRHYGFNPISHRSAIIETMCSTIYIVFELPKKLKVHAILNNSTYGFLERNVKIYIFHKNKIMLVVEVIFPSEGQYGLDIYARDPKLLTDRKTMSHCCKYLINYNSSFSQIDLGGKEKQLKQLGIQPLSHVHPIIEMPSDSNVVDIKFLITKVVEFTFELRFEGDTSGFHLPSENVHLEPQSNSITFKVKIDSPCVYVFVIYASSTNQNELPIVFTYLIKRPPS